MEIDEDKWERRGVIGLFSLVSLMMLTMFLGTASGRAVLLFIIIVLVAIFGLGWVGDVLYGLYEEYTG
jgi:hypothetical protein